MSAPVTARAIQQEGTDLRTQADAHRLAEALATEPLSDAGNAHRFVLLHGSAILFDVTARRRLVWEGNRWLADDTDEWMRRGVATARAVIAQAALESDPARRKALAGHGIASEGLPRLRAMLELAETHAEVAVRGADFDADPWVLNVANGTLDLRTGTLRPHDPADLLTMLAPVDHVPDATAPRFQQFLTDLTGGNAAKAAYLQRVAGYCLSGQTTEQTWFLFYGLGGNGKTVLLEVLRGVLGTYARQAGFATFLNSGHESIREDIARLEGARLVTALEPPDNQRFNEPLLKLLTGGDVITARELYRGSREFRPTFKLLLAGNHKPQVWGTDEGFWRRVRLFECPHTVPPDRRVKDLHRLLLAEEGPGILRWAVEGCLAWQRDGLGEPPEITTATQAYREDEDVLADFVDGALHAATGARTAQPDLRRAYEQYCADAGVTPLGARAFVARLRERGLAQVKSNGKRWWLGVELRGAVPVSTGNDSDEPPF